MCGACTIHRGAGWEQPTPASRDEAKVSLLLLGEVAPGRTAATVSDELDRVLESERAGGREPVVLWLGNNVFPAGPVPEGHGDQNCVSAAEHWASKGPAALAAVVRKHGRLGTASYAILGNRDWRCGHPELELQDDTEGVHPWAMPANNYVIRVGADGSTRVVSACAAIQPATCAVEDGSEKEQALVDLVMVDSIPWAYPPAKDSPATDAAKTSLAQLDALLDGLGRMNPETAPPRILVSHLPIETAGLHGQGGKLPTATFRQLPEKLRHGLAAGMFVGAVSAHDRSLQATADVSPAVRRSARVWLEAPVFQVVSGASSRPDAGAVFTARQIPYFNGMTIEPDLYSTHAGFARVVLSSEQVDVVLHARRHGKWQTGGFSFAMRRPDHPKETPRTVTAPCLRCDPVTGAADSERVSDRD